MSEAGRVSIQHYAGPPIIGGVESTIGQHARRLANQGYRVQVIAGRGKNFDPEVEFVKISRLDSRHPQVMEVGEELSAGKLSAQFYDLRDTLVQELAKVLAGVDVCIVHNALTLHKNLAFTAALSRLVSENPFRLVAWCHDFAWQDPLYLPACMLVIPGIY
jgi:mannosylglucosylglycerate synthase